MVGPKYASSSVLTKYSSLICDTSLKCKEQIFKSFLTLSSCFVLWVFFYFVFFVCLKKNKIHFRPQLSYFSILSNDISLSCHSLVTDVSPVGNEFNKKVVYKVSASLSLIVGTSLPNVFQHVCGYLSNHTDFPLALTLVHSVHGALHSVPITYILALIHLSLKYQYRDYGIVRKVGFSLWSSESAKTREKETDSKSSTAFRKLLD